jgi:hypothetical protein
MGWILQPCQALGIENCAAAGLFPYKGCVATDAAAKVAFSSEKLDAGTTGM